MCAAGRASRAPGLHVVRYEDMLERAAQAFAAIDRFLQLGSPRDRLERAIRRSSFKVLQEQEKRRGFREKTDVAERFFRAGKAGQWRTALSRAQIDRVVEAHGDQMARFGYLPSCRRRRQHRDRQIHAPRRVHLRDRAAHGRRHWLLFAPLMVFGKAAFSGIGALSSWSATTTSTSSFGSARANGCTWACPSSRSVRCLSARRCSNT